VLQGCYLGQRVDEEVRGHVMQLIVQHLAGSEELVGLAGLVGLLGLVGLVGLVEFVGFVGLVG
jgi:hypothetical protein